MVGSVWRRVTAAVVRVLTQNAEPRQIALGAAVGVFAAGLPFPFLQVILAALFAAALRANQLAALTTVWLANPAVFYLEYLIGRSVLGRLAPALMGAGVPSWDSFLEQLRQSAFPLVRSILLPTLVGSMLFGLACAGAAYGITLWLAAVWRERSARAVASNLPAAGPGDGA